MWKVCGMCVSLPSRRHLTHHLTSPCFLVQVLVVTFRLTYASEVVILLLMEVRL